MFQTSIWKLNLECISLECSYTRWLTSHAVHNRSIQATVDFVAAGQNLIPKRTRFPRGNESASWPVMLDGFFLPLHREADCSAPGRAGPQGMPGAAGPCGGHQQPPALGHRISALLPPEHFPLDGAHGDTALTWTTVCSSTSNGSWRSKLSLSIF